MTNALVTVVLVVVVIAIIFSPNLLVVIKTKQRGKQDAEEAKQVNKSKKEDKDNRTPTSADGLILRDNKKLASSPVAQSLNSDFLDSNTLQLNNSLSEKPNIYMVSSAGIARKNLSVRDTWGNLTEKPISIPSKTPMDDFGESFKLNKNVSHCENIDLFSELENNIETANTSWTGKLLSFQTRVGESILSEVDSLPADVLKELNEVYIDIRLANRLVWLSEVVGRISKEVEESYVTLCANIAERLEGIIFRVIGETNQGPKL